MSKNIRGQIYSKIVSMGVNYPKRVVTNKDLEKLMDTSDEWIQQRSGIKERRWVEPGDSCSGMALAASEQALKKAGLKADNIDAIVYACLLSDYMFPGGGVQLQKMLGCSNTIPALDIRNQCSGFLYALSVADAWVRSGMYKRILIVGSEIHSTSMDITTRGRDISVLFGDAAGAMIIEATEVSSAGEKNESHIIDHFLGSEGQYAEKLVMLKPSPSDHPRLTPQSEIGIDFYPSMDGKYVFKNAVLRMCESFVHIAKKNKVRPEDIDFVIAHQANGRIIQMVMEQLGLPQNKTHYTLDRFGNTTAATIPLTMNEAVDQNKIKRGDLVFLTAFGSGFTWGGSLLRY